MNSHNVVNWDCTVECSLEDERRDDDQLVRGDEYHDNKLTIRNMSRCVKCGVLLIHERKERANVFDCFCF